MSRLTDAVSNIRTKCDDLDPSDLAQLDADMAVDFREHFAYQQAQAHAHAAGRISTSDAQLIYIALGEVGSSANGGWAAGTDTPTKVAVTLAMNELLRMAAKS